MTAGMPMARIVSARAYANNEVAYVAWSLDAPIAGCLGFDITRIYPETGEERPLAVWVPFKGQTNTTWSPQTTRVWPIQKLTWRDLTLRKRRDALSLRPDEVTVRYRVRPVGRFRPGLEPVPVDPSAPKYEGPTVPLAYAGEAVQTNPVRVTQRFGDVRATFTNGILAAQWLRRVLEEKGENLTPKTVSAHISTPGDDIRAYLTGDVLNLLKEQLVRAGAEPGSNLKMAIYELWDEELTELIVAHKDSVELILSNSSKDHRGGHWDGGNGLVRQILTEHLGNRKVDRMFNNGHIGHNKFVVFEDAAGKARSVMTGSTNWTPTGLAGQSNNALLIESPEIAAAFADYWADLLADTGHFVQPNPIWEGTKNAQGPDLRAANAKKRTAAKLSDGTTVTFWRSPNTHAKSRQSALPPDLAEVFELIGKAKDAIFFAVFLPSQSGKGSVIEEAIRVGNTHPGLIVQGAVSDVMAMPNYIPPDHSKDTPGEKREQPAIYDNGEVHVVRAIALNKDDIVGSLEGELLSVGKAIIHDKIVVIDPLSNDCTVIVGSHNLGLKASYENDENLLIIRGNPKLAQAYMTHVLDVYEHYRFRALQRIAKDNNMPLDGGMLVTDESWYTTHATPERGALSRYLGGAGAAGQSDSPPVDRPKLAAGGGRSGGFLGRIFGRS
jgi:phosphatidylserine/phosphatidylglycerophosphate/cardiolipin synthase-like enzyme